MSGVKEAFCEVFWKISNEWEWKQTDYGDWDSLG